MQTAANTARNPLQTHVGYVNQEIQQNTFAMIGVAFEGTDSQDMTLEKLITGDITPIPCDWDFSTHTDTANMIEVYTGNNKYDFYYFLSDGWDDDAAGGEGDYFTGWCTWDGYKATVTLAPGDAIWLKARTGNLVITTPGLVYMGESVIDVPNGQFQMFAFHKPVELDLNDASQVSYTGLIAEPCDWDYTTHTDSANMIEVYTGNNKYDFFYYLSDGWDDSAAGGEGDYFTGWCTWDGYKPTEKVPVLRGLWAKGRKGAFTINMK